MNKYDIFFFLIYPNPTLLNPFFEMILYFSS